MKKIASFATGFVIGFMAINLFVLAARTMATRIDESTVSLARKELLLQDFLRTEEDHEIPACFTAREPRVLKLEHEPRVIKLEHQPRVIKLR
jgi:hypothetical protein